MSEPDGDVFDNYVEVRDKIERLTERIVQSDCSKVDDIRSCKKLERRLRKAAELETKIRAKLARGQRRKRKLAELKNEIELLKSMHNNEVKILRTDMERVLQQTPIRPEIIADDVLQKIVKMIASPTRKINLERVCHRLGKYAKTPESWLNIRYVEINGHDVPDQGTVYAIITRPLVYIRLTELSFASAVHSIFTRIRHVKIIQISSDRASSPNNLCRTLFQAIMAQGVKAFRLFKKLKLKSISLKSTESVFSVVDLINAFQSQLTVFNLRYLFIDAEAAAIQFWKAVGKCVNLKSFDIFAYNGDRNIGYGNTAENIIKNALCEKAIRSLNAGILSSEQMAAVVSSIRTDRRPFRHLATISENFIEMVPVSILTCLKSLDVNCRQPFQSPSTSPYFPKLVKLLRFCPQLNQLTIIIDQGSIEVELLIATDLVVEVLHVLHMRQLSDLIRVTFVVTRHDIYLTYNRKKICEMLVHNFGQHNCEVEDLLGSGDGWRPKRRFLKSECTIRRVDQKGKVILAFGLDYL